jgi:hypothetical protein
MKSFLLRGGERRIVMLIALSALIGEILAIRPPNIYGEPYLVAKNILAGLGFTFTYPITQLTGPTCYVTPLYTYLQAGILYLGLGERGIQVVNILFLQAGCYALYVFFRRFTTPILALVIFAAVSFYVPFWILAYSLEPNSLNLLLVVLSVICLYDLAKTPTRKGWIILGVLFGIQLLLRPDILIGVALFTPWLVIARKSHSKETVKGLVMSLLIALAMVAPWTIRNYVTFHKFVLVSANSGMNLYEGNNYVATGEFSENPATEESRREFQAIQAYSQSHDQIEVDQYRLQLAKQWMLSHPMEVIALDAKKVWYHWFGRPIMGEQFHYRYENVAMAYRIGGALMVLLGFYALYRMRDKKLRSLLLVMFAYSTLVSAIFFVQSRHRILKVDPFLVPLAVMGVADVVVTFRSRRTAESHTNQQIQRDLKVTTTII